MSAGVNDDFLHPHDLSLASEDLGADDGFVVLFPSTADPDLWLPMACGGAKSL